VRFIDHLKVEWMALWLSEENFASWLKENCYKITRKW
jgi:hypothetical protein